MISVPAFLREPGQRLWFGQSSRYRVERFDEGDGLTIRALARGTPIRLQFTIREVLQLLEDGRLRKRGTP